MIGARCYLVYVAGAYLVGPLFVIPRGSQYVIPMQFLNVKIVRKREFEKCVICCGEGRIA